MEQLDNVNTHLQAVLNKVDRDRTAEINKLKDEEQRLLDHLRDFEIEKENAAAENGTLNVSDDDLIEINVGGKIIAAKRGTLCQWEGTRLEALFSGRWDKKLVRDNNGRIFLDLNGDCFQMIVDYMNELAISSEEDPPEYPIVNEELEEQFQHQLQLFGLSDPAAILGSEIIKRLSHGYTIHGWLNENDGGSECVKIYCSSRDGLSAEAFHKNCVRRGPTLTVIETAAGDVAGGYTNTSWDSESYYTSRYASANKAFLFALSGFGTSSPCKMELKDKDNNRAMDYNSVFGPAFGGKDSYYPQYGGYQAEQKHDLIVSGSTLTLNTGIAYEQGPASMTNNKEYAIKRIEVFSVSNGEPIHLDPRKRKQYSRSAKNPPAVDRFTKEVNEAINEKWKSLSVLEAQISSFEESFADEQSFIDSLSMANGETSDIITLNVSGTMMTTNRATLMVAEDSVLAQQFDDTKWTEQGNSNSPKVKEWTPDDVTNWVKSIEGIPDSVASLFWENEINGLEMLALDRDELKDMGVKRVGTICLLMDEIKSLKVNQDVMTLIEHSPYCFGKILDHLRLKRLHSINLAEEPSLPTVCESQKKRFEKVVKYYFPGDSSSFILGPPLET